MTWQIVVPNIPLLDATPLSMFLGNIVLNSVEQLKGTPRYFPKLCVPGVGRASSKMDGVRHVLYEALVPLLLYQFLSDCFLFVCNFIY